MPLKGGSGKKTRDANVREMVGSKTFAKGKPKRKRIEMAVAAAYSQARRGK